MKINFVGIFNKPGYVGEISDETHLALEMENLGHEVIRIDRAQWREYIIEDKPKGKYEIPEDLKADICIVAKWPHFFDGRFIAELKKLSNAPVLYWVWDYMDDNGLPDWHKAMVDEADLYLGNDVRSIEYKDIKNAYYFPFDCADESLPYYFTPEKDKKFDITFFGSCLGQGDRIPIIKGIFERYPQIKIFSWNYREWDKLGIIADPPVYGQQFNQMVATSKICLQISVNDNTWGYWSNRTGKVLLAGGFLLAHYAPGMETFLRDGADYFSSIDEACEKIGFYLANPDERDKIAARGHQIGREKFSSAVRVKELMILCDRYLKGGLSAVYKAF